MPSVVDGMRMSTFPKREGLMTLAPEQLLAIRIPVQRVTDGDIKGYQRHLSKDKARKTARWLQENPDYMKKLGVVEVSLTADGAFYTDGQHRGAGAVIARLPIRVVVTKRTTEEARALFALQAKASRPSRNVLIFDGDGIYEEYIQDAVTDENHPWNKLISTSQQGSSTTRMSATAANGMLRIYFGQRPSGFKDTMDEERFDKVDADRLATLMSCFGTRQSNPLAYGSVQLRAIAAVARKVFMERPSDADDVDRWVRQMSAFPFTQYAYLRSQTDIMGKMVDRWNKRLKDDDPRKIS